MNKQDDNALTDNERMRTRFAAYFDWIIKGLIVVSFTFIWRMYESQQEYLQKQAVLDVRVTQLEKDIARIEGNMVTIETLKRMELFVNLIAQQWGIDKRIDLIGPGKK